MNGKSRHRRVRGESSNNQGIKRELKVLAAHLCQAQKGQNHPSDIEATTVTNEKGW